MLVVDTSAALAAPDADPELVARLADDGDLDGPHLIDTEMLHALRQMTMTGAIGDDRAADVRTDFAELTLVRYPHEPLKRNGCGSCGAT